MSKIILNKNDFFIKEWNEEIEKYDTFKLNDGMDLISNWRSTFEIEGTITLKDLMTVLKGYGESIIRMIEMLTQCNIMEFIYEMDENDSKKDNLECKHIEIKKYYEVWYFKNKVIFNESIECFGKMKQPEDGCENCALEFSNWSNLQNLPIKLNKNLTLTVLKKDYKLNKEYATETYFTLGVFFNALFDELCFMGCPMHRDEQLDELKSRVEDIKNGTAELISWDELEKELDE